MDSPVFIDYLSMKQVHPDGGLPMINKGCVWSVDEDGKVEWTTHRAIEHEGSFGTKLRLRCDGFTVEASGNPGFLRRRVRMAGDDPKKKLGGQVHRNTQVSPELRHLTRLARLCARETTRV